MSSSSTPDATGIFLSPLIKAGGLATPALSLPKSSASLLPRSRLTLLSLIQPADEQRELSCSPNGAHSVRFPRHLVTQFCAAAPDTGTRLGDRRAAQLYLLSLCRSCT